MLIDSIGTPALWIGFIAFVLFMLALDLGVFPRSVGEYHSARFTVVQSGRRYATPLLLARVASKPRISCLPLTRFRRTSP